MSLLVGVTLFPNYVSPQEKYVCWNSVSSYFEFPGTNVFRSSSWFTQTQGVLRHNLHSNWTPLLPFGLQFLLTSLRCNVMYTRIMMSTVCKTVLCRTAQTLLLAVVVQT